MNLINNLYNYRYKVSHLNLYYTCWKINAECIARELLTWTSNFKLSIYNLFLFFIFFYFYNLYAK